MRNEDSDVPVMVDGMYDVASGCIVWVSQETGQVFGVPDDRERDDRAVIVPSDMYF